MEKKTKEYEKVLSEATLGVHIKNAKYDLTGKVLKRAKQLMDKQEEGGAISVEKFYKLNMGNPHVLGQPPITFIRQVIAAALYPDLSGSSCIPPDAKARANHYLTNVDRGALSAYSEGAGFRVLRESVSKYLEDRDSHPAPVDNIFLLNGAADGIDGMLTFLIENENDGIMLPIPEYPGYSFLVNVRKGKVVPYYLEEEENWGLKISQLKESYDKAVAEGIRPKAIVIINPNNPTGSVLTRENIEEIIKFCYENSILILADQVYQFNLYGVEFVSFKKVLCEIPAPYNKVELISVNSTSKGFYGECGLRGGYLEFHNIEPYIIDQYDKTRDLSAVNIAGGIATEVMCNPPKAGVNSPEVVEQYEKEIGTIRDNMAAKATMLTTRLNKMKNLKCTRICGAMYAFPQIFLTESAIAAAKAKDCDPDEFFCLELVEAAGIIAVPGSGFGQKPGTYHMRLTNLIWDPKEFNEMLDKLEDFCKKFFEKYP